jgi:hypothetical protein
MRAAREKDVLTAMVINDPETGHFPCLLPGANCAVRPCSGVFLPDAILLGVTINFQLCFVKQLLEIYSAAFWAVTLS